MLRPPTFHPPRAVGQNEEGSFLVPLRYLLRGASPCAREPVNIKGGNSGPGGSWVPFLSGSGGQKWAEALL